MNKDNYKVDKFRFFFEFNYNQNCFNELIDYKKATRSMSAAQNSRVQTIDE
jgi:hypothetical protein